MKEHVESHVHSHTGRSVNTKSSTADISFSTKLLTLYIEYTLRLKVWKSKICNVFKGVSAHQGCIYPIKHTEKTVILWNLIAISNIGFLFYYTLKYNYFCNIKLYLHPFSSLQCHMIFRKQCNMLIYYECRYSIYIYMYTVYILYILFLYFTVFSPKCFLLNLFQSTFISIQQTFQTYILK